MLVPGTIRKIYDYYFDAPLHRAELRCAFREFAEDEHASIPQADEKIGVEFEGYFNEWFLYDYLWRDKLTTLEHFVRDNPLRLTEAEMKFYATLMETNTYGLFEVTDIEPLTNMTLKNLQTGKTCIVREVKATMNTPLHAVFFARVADVGGHHEMVGADSIVLGTFGAGLKKIARTWTDKITPRDAYKIASAKRK